MKNKKNEKKIPEQEGQNPFVQKGKLPHLPKIVIKITQSDIKSFLEQFRADVAKKRLTYQSFLEKFRK